MFFLKNNKSLSIVNKIKDNQLLKIERKYKKLGCISSIKDLCGDSSPSSLFFLQIRAFGYLLNNDCKKTVSRIGVKFRKLLHPKIAKEAPKYLMNPHVVENRQFLLNYSTQNAIGDNQIVLPDEPVIWLQNHDFKDDALSSIATIPRHTYIFFGSLPQFYNSSYGLSAQLGGVVLVNRKVKESRSASISKAIEVLSNGADILICPEATWNKTPNLLQLEYWNGIYEIAKKTKSKIVPIVHYLSDPFERSNPIHTVIDDPIDISELSLNEAKELLRDKVATWKYLMMEKYGQSTREDLLREMSPDAYWKSFLNKLTKEVDYYDSEIERSCDFRERSIIRAEDVFKSIANINITAENANHKLYAKRLIETNKCTDYQRLY